ncbi:MAG: anaerobic ribonucleoside-triphosphate reductase activating protein [Desulfatibacillaceae bacterium]
MQFGGIRKTSLIDYPDQIAAVVFTAGCNFRCPYCHNPQLVKGNPDPSVSQDVVLDFLEARAGFLDGVVISGGEPTLQPDLTDFMATVRNMGYLVKLDTNGSRPEILAEVLRRNLADYVAMDVKTLPDNYPETVGAHCGPGAIKQSIRMLLAWDGEYEFRTTCVSPLVNDEVIDLLGPELSGAKRWALQQFVPDRVLDRDFATARCFGHDELEHMQKSMAPHVAECILRD